jgi:tetratricopeptide (TPR) repeat protein
MLGSSHSLIYVIPLLAIAAGVTPAQAQAQAQTETQSRGSFDTSQNIKPPPPSAKQLWDWYGEASKLHDQGKVDEAWKVYKRIWEHKKTYDVAASMGEVCAKRGEYAEAARYYRFALETVVPTQSPDFVEAVKEELHKALAKVTEVEINVSTSDKSANELHVIDEKSQRELELPLFLEPGTYNLKAQAPGFAPRFKSITAAAGKVVQWDVDLSPLSRALAVDDRTVKTRHPWLVFGIGGLITAGLGTTSYFLAQKARAEYNEGVDLGEDLSEGACVDGGKRCQEIEAHRDAADRAQNLALLSAGGAGLAAIATIVTYVLWEDTEPVQVSIERTSSDGWKVGWTHAF